MEIPVTIPQCQKNHPPQWDPDKSARDPEDACLQQVSSACIRLPSKFSAQVLPRRHHARCFVVNDTNHVAVGDLEILNSSVNFLLDVLRGMALQKQARLQNTRMKLPTAVNKVSSRRVVAFSGLRGPAIRGEGNELSFGFQQLREFLPSGLVSLLHQWRYVGARRNGVI